MKLRIALLLLGGLTTWVLTRPAPPPAPEVMRLSIPLPEGGQTTDWSVSRLAISPDGMTVAYFDDALQQTGLLP